MAKHHYDGVTLLDETFGALSAIKSIARDLTNRFQPVALNNQFASTDLTDDEIITVNQLTSDIRMSVAKAQDGIAEIYNNRGERHGNSSTEA